jgi:serine phosphatase RsbU (regulator of sigma subunit)
MTGLTDDTESMRRLEVLTDQSLAQTDLESLLEELLDRITDLLKVDTAAVLLIDKDAGELVTTATKGLEEEVLHGFRVPVGQGFSGTVFETRQPRIIEHVDESNVVSPILLKAGIQSLMGTPLVASGEIIGVLTIGTRYHRKFGDNDLRLLQAAADRVALATRARQTYAERVAAVVLQRSLVPGRLPSPPGFEMAGRYIPAGSGGVGGDWYDVFPLPDGRSGVVIGDVVGRGMSAAVVMGRLRSALRAYALESTDPADVLERLDRKAQHFEAGQMTTVLYMVIEPGTDELIISSAGHLLPILAPPNEAAFTVDVPVDPPLATLPSVARRRTAVSLPAGAIMCLFTDGLVERRDEPLTESLERLRAAVTAGTPNSVCESVLFAMLPSQGQPDDIAVLVLRRTGGSATD